MTLNSRKSIRSGGSNEEKVKEQSIKMGFQLNMKKTKAMTMGETTNLTHLKNSSLRVL